VRDESENVII